MIRQAQIRWIALAAGVSLVASITGQPRLTDIGVLPGGGYSVAQAVSGDASSVVGFSDSGQNGNNRAFRWTPFGIQDLGTLPGHDSAEAYGISADGSTVVGMSRTAGGSFNMRAFRWTEPSGPEDLGTLPGGNYSYAFGTNQSGNVVVGYSTTGAGDRAFRWSQGTGMVSLGALPGGNDSRAMGVNSAGDFVVGRSGSSQGTRAFLWSEQLGMQNLGILPGGLGSFAKSVSHDGSVVVGTCDASPFPKAFRWTQPGGMQGLGHLGGQFSIGEGVSADGKVAVGYSRKTVNADDHAFLWTQALGMVDLNDYLPGLGVDLSGWTLSWALGVSPDGTAITGAGIYQGRSRAWLVTGLEPNLFVLRPISQEVHLGRITAGSLDSLGSDDDNPQILCKFVVPNQAAPFLDVHLMYQSELRAPDSVEFVVKAKWNTAGLFTMRLHQLNYTSGFEEVTLPDTPVAGVYGVFRSSGTSPGSDYVRQADGSMRARISVRHAGPSAGLLPCLAFEFAQQQVRA